MKKAIWFDMDGVMAGLYNVENWLDYLLASDPYPYKAARPLINMSRLARLLNRLQADGYHIGIVSWLSKNSTIEYNEAVTNAKLAWLNKHLHSVHWNEIVIVPYGTPKHEAVSVGGILFDDEEHNRKEWSCGNSENLAFDVDNILGILEAVRNGRLFFLVHCFNTLQW